MSKAALAFGSFALGVAATLFALSGSLTLSSAQGRITPQRPIPPLAVGSGAGIPTVPVITSITQILASQPQTWPMTWTGRSVSDVFLTAQY